MFAYLLILAELSILASVFWYVFIREPRPLEIKENLWGYYDQTVHASTGYGINSKGQLASDESRKARKIRRVVHTGHVLLRSARHGVKRKEVPNTSDLKNGWVYSDETKPLSTVSVLLAILAEKLSQLSVKLSS